MIRFDQNNEGPSTGDPGEPGKHGTAGDTEEPSYLRMDGYDDCILGTCIQFGRPPVIAYDMPKVLQSMIADGMTRDEAVEFFEFNQLGAYMGPFTPVFINTDTEELEFLLQHGVEP